MTSNAQVVFCTVPTEEKGLEIARELVQRKLAACVNMVPGITSVYRWKDNVETESEHLLIIKTHSTAISALKQAIQELHPYELPEIIAVPIVEGLPAYLTWIEENTRPD